MWTQLPKVFSTRVVSVCSRAFFACSGSPPPLALRRSAASCFVPWLGSGSLEIGKSTVGHWKKCLEIDKQCKFL